MLLAPRFCTNAASDDQTQPRYNSGHSRAAPVDHYDNVSSHEKAARLLAADNVPIVFYGKMIDQDGRAISGVTISYWISEAAKVMWGNPTDTRGSCVSGADGTFVIQGKGTGVGVARMEKPGYRHPANGKRAFSYGPGVSPTHRHNPDPTNPVELLLIRDDLPEAKCVPIPRRLSFRWNASPVVISLGPKVGTLTLVPTRSIPEPGGNIRSGFDWSVETRCAGFGMIPRTHNDTIARGAPSDGYQSVFRYGSTKDEIPWKCFPETYFFIKTSDGMYGELALTVNVDAEDNSAVSGVVAVWLNESGGRNVDHDL